MGSTPRDLRRRVLGIAVAGVLAAAPVAAVLHGSDVTAPVRTSAALGCAADAPLPVVVVTSIVDLVKVAEGLVTAQAGELPVDPSRTLGEPAGCPNP